MAIDNIFIRKNQERDNFKGIYRSGIDPHNTLRRVAFNIARNEDDFKRFEKAVIKYGTQLNIGLGVSFEDYVKLDMPKYIRNYKKRHKVNYEPPLISFMEYFTGNETQKRAAYVAQLMDIMIKQHYKNKSTAEALRSEYKKAGYTIGNKIPTRALDLTFYDGINELGSFNLDEFLSALGGEAKLNRMANKDFYKKADKNKIDKVRFGKAVKDLNWLESWYYNTRYALDQLGWSNVAEMLDIIFEYGDISKLYETVFKGEDYNFIFKYDDDGTNKDENKLVMALDKYMRDNLSKYRYNKEIKNRPELKSYIKDIYDTDDREQTF